MSATPVPSQPAETVEQAGSLVEGAEARVLLVDDEPSVLRANEEVLRQIGCVVTSAPSAHQAMERLESEIPFEVIITDLKMPGLSGLDLIRAVRERELGLPVVVLTGNPEIESAAAALEHGAFRYLTKPVSPENLGDTVERAARWYRLAEAAREAQRTVDPVGVEAHATFSAALDCAWISMQPIVSLRDRSVYAYEARIRTEQEGLRRPAELFRRAGVLGRMGELGRVIRARVADFLQSGHPDTTVFVHVHSLDLLDLDLYSPDGVLTRHADRIVLQLTDRTDLEQVGELKSRIERLRRLGFRIAIDGLGAGYASLSTVAELAPDVVKADVTLVRGIDSSRVKQKLLRALLALGRELRVAIVAEGVERPAERDCIASMGGNLQEGFLFAPPAAGTPEPHAQAFDGSGPVGDPTPDS
jgi:EAL domain-containing protein (putative c-di-GMP-specific phosphodiesterase class I)